MRLHESKISVCPNCNTHLSSGDNYCSHCGQKNQNPNIPLKYWIGDLIENLFNFDSKFWASFRDLIIKPGLITKNFNDNKRARYIAPVKFYFLISFLYFIIPSLIHSPSKSGYHDGREIRDSFYDLVKVAGLESSLEKMSLIKTLPDSTIKRYLDSSGFETNILTRPIVYNLVRFYTGHLTIEDLKTKILDIFSKLIFVLMPFFALYISMLYRRQKRHFSEHLTFSVHFHTIIYFWLLIRYLLTLLIDINVVEYAFIALILIYLFLALKRVYPQRNGTLVFKTFALGIGYIMINAVFIIIAFGMSLL